LLPPSWPDPLAVLTNDIQRFNIYIVAAHRRSPHRHVATRDTHDLVDCDADRIYIC
jgi:hypothetical protein